MDFSKLSKPIWAVILTVGVHLGPVASAFDPGLHPIQPVRKNVIGLVDFYRTPEALAEQVEIAALFGETQRFVDSLDAFTLLHGTANLEEYLNTFFLRAYEACAFHIVDLLLDKKHFKTMPDAVTEAYRNNEVEFKPEVRVKYFRPPGSDYYNGVFSRDMIRRENPYYNCRKSHDLYVNRYSRKLPILEGQTAPARKLNTDQYSPTTR